MKLVDKLMMSLAVLFLAAYATPIIDPNTPLSLICQVVSWLTWGVFGVEYLYRLYKADQKIIFVKSSWLDLIVLTLPMLRPLRLLRLVTLLSYVNKKASTALRGKIAVYVSVGSALLAFCGSLATLDAERSAQGSNITTFGDSIWWSVTTMTTVGYGDHYPVTVTGRIAAIGLMIGGVAILGTTTGLLASWIVERVSEEIKQDLGSSE